MADLRNTVGIKIGVPTHEMWTTARIDSQLSLLKQAGGAYVLVQTHNGGTIIPESKVRPWIDSCAKHGLAFGLWGVTYTDPVGEAKLHAAQIRKYRPKIAAINAEIDYHGNPNLGGIEAVRWQRNFQYLDTFDAEDLGPEPPALALNTLGAATGQNVYWMPHERWMQRHDIHAQAYFNAYDEYRPDLCEAHWLRAGWPLERIKLTLGCYTAEAGSKGLSLRLADYLPLLAPCRTVGANLFMAETLVDDDVRDLAKVIAMGRAERYDGAAPPPAPVDTAANRTQALIELKESIEYWRATGMTEETLAIQRQTLAWRVLQMAQSGANVRAVRDLLDTRGAPRP